MPPAAGVTTTQAPWQKTFLAFAGPGIRRPSESMRVTDIDAEGILEDLAARDWQTPVYVGTGRHAGYTLCHAAGAWCTALFHGRALVGFYADSYLWIAASHRGRSLSTPLILAAADQRGGTILPPGIALQGYTAASVAVHLAAHRHAVRTALAKGLPVPAEVLEEIRVGGKGSRGPALPVFNPAG
ncbi:MAG: hypothetical protein H6R10_3542 [Rhodocyclaceae bacterium]|nr:hypothetical protein [Rhodocyclaceae bacterium]